ncbi:MAG: MotA/TolQ/ExbB proton channel family protein [Planctomycetota bacterium]|jgi:biopolymer transport protein ExbB
MRYILIVVVLAIGTVLSAQQPSEPPTSEKVPADQAAADPMSKEPDAGVGDAKGSEQPEEADTADDTEESATEPETPSWQEILDDVLQSGAMGLLREGGFFMWPILIMGIIATGVIIERYRSLKMLSTDTAALRADVAEQLRSDRVEEALETCDAQQGPVPAVLSAGVRKFLVLRRLNYDAARIEEQVVKAMDDYSVHVAAALERHLPVLATVSSAAPMLGFLGTVQGMIIAFRDIVAKMGETNVVEAAADGIQTALLTTCFGLIVGIPAFIAYNYFTSVINRHVLDVEESATELMETVTLHMALEERENGDPAAS